MPNNVFVWLEQTNGTVPASSWEIFGPARKIANAGGGKLQAILVGNAENLNDLAQQAIQYGADTIFMANDAGFKTFRAEPYAALITQLAQDHQPKAILMPASGAGLELAPHVAAKLEVGLASDCIDVTTENENLMVTRPVLSGNLMATVTFEETYPQMATLRPHIFTAPQTDPSRIGEIIAVDPALSENDINIHVEAFAAAVETVNLADARIIVSGGRGVGGPDGFEILRDLANVLGGAVGASRAAVDAGWVPYAYQIGQSGKVVQPDVYIACGISGAIQHLAGMKTAKTIIAINKNPNVPLFKYAQYGIVGDLFEVVPALTEEFRKRRK